MNKKRILVTGGAGFIGSTLVETLLAEGLEVIVLDNMHTGSKDNLSGVMDRITLIEEGCEKADLSGISVDGIFHLGMYSSSPMYKEEPELVGSVVTGSINIFELAKRLNVPVVFASTSSMYTGNPVPWKEDMPIHVFDYYTEGRYYLERIAELYNKLHGVRSVGLRFFSVYGPKEKSKGKYANLVSQFLWDMQQGKSPVIYGDGEQERDLIYVDDVIVALKKAMTHEADFGIFNVGTGETYTLNQLVDTLNESLGTSIKAEHIENPVKNYVPVTQADCTKAKDVLGFEAKISLKEGIERLL